MIKIITIDGPASSGKGTVAKLLAAKLGFHYLESGAIYRALALWVTQHYPHVVANEEQVLALIKSLDLKFSHERIWLDGCDVTAQLRGENIGMLASKYGALARVRQSLLQFQRDFAKEPGLVTDGRDMGSVVFPNASLKIFLTASSEKRAERRYLQLHQLDKSVTIKDILHDIIARDAWDSTRSAAPLSYDSSFKILDNSELSIEQTISLIMTWFEDQ